MSKGDIEVPAGQAPCQNDPRLRARNPDYPNLLMGGVPGNKGGGAKPSRVRAMCLDNFEKFVETSGPALEAIGKAMAERDFDTVKQFAAAGWTASEVNKAIRTLATHALPKRVEVKLQNEDVVRVCLDVAHGVFGPGRLEALATALVKALDLPGANELPDVIDVQGREPEPRPN